MARIIGFLIGFLAFQAAFAQEHGSIVTVDLGGGKVIYEAYGQQKDLDEIIDILRQRVKKTGVTPENDTAIVLASKTLTINQIQTFCAALQAYGFLDVQVFTFDRDKTRLQGLSFARGIPFTSDRAELMRAAGK